jgi:hypothetical protein
MACTLTTRRPRPQSPSSVAQPEATTSWMTSPLRSASGLPALAALVGGKPPLRVPKWLGRLIAGEHIVTMMTETRAGSNAKAKRDLS